MHAAANFTRHVAVNVCPHAVQVQQMAGLQTLDLRGLDVVGFPPVVQLPHLQVCHLSCCCRKSERTRAWGSSGKKTVQLPLHRQRFLSHKTPISPGSG